MDSLPSELHLVMIQYISPLDLLRFIYAMPHLVDLLTTKIVLDLADEYGNTLLHLVAEAEILVCGNETLPSPFKFKRTFCQWKEAWQTKGGMNSQHAYLVGSERRFPTRLPSHRAAAYLMNLFLDNPYINPNLWDGEGATPFAVAVRRGNYDMAKLMLDSEKIDPNLRSVAGISPLCQGALENLDEIVALLISYNHVVDINNWTTGGIPPSIFKSEKTRPLLKILVYIQEFDFKQHRLFNEYLYLAAEILQAGDERARRRGQGNTDLLETLLSERRLDVNGTPILAMAAVQGNIVVLGHLLRRGDIQVNLRDPETGMTALTYAARSGSEHFVRMLLTHGGVEIDSRDNMGCTPLYYALQWYYRHRAVDLHSIVQMLVTEGANDLLNNEEREEDDNMN